MLAFFQNNVGDRVKLLENLTFKIAYYVEITALSGTISFPTGATLLPDQWPGGKDAEVCGIPGGTGTPPDFEATPYTATLDVAGNYIVTGLPTNPSALFFYITIKLKDLGNLNIDQIIVYADVNVPDGRWLEVMQSAGLVYGFDYYNPLLRGDISFVEGTRTFSIAPKLGQLYFNYWIKSEEYQVTSQQDVVIPNATGLYFIYFNGVTLIASITPWSFEDDYAFVAIVYWNSSLGEGILQEERHKNNIPRSIHKYLHETVNSRYESGFAGTFNDNGLFTIEAGEYHDEDIEHSILQQTTCNLFYRDTDLTWLFTKTNSKFYIENTDIIQYDNTGTLTDVPNSNHVSYYIFASNDVDNPIWSIAGQRVDATLANARLNQSPSNLSLGTLPSPELKLLYQVIIKRVGTNETVESVIDFRENQALVSTNFTATSHLSLSELNGGDGVGNHANAFNLLGRLGGQIAYGGNAPGEDLTLGSTNDATKGNINLGSDSTYDEVNDRLGLNTLTPDYTLDVNGITYTEGFINNDKTILSNKAISPTLTATANNLSITNFADRTFIELITDGGNYDITGIDSTGVINGQIFKFAVLDDRSGDVKFKANSANSSLGNRFIIPGDLTIKPGEFGVEFMWRNDLIDNTGTTFSGFIRIQ